MSNQGYYQPPPPRTNGLAIAGFVVSLVGLFTAGILCPIGLILSLIGLARAPRGFAIAGTVIGLIGTAIPLIFIFIFGAAIFSMFSCLSFGFAAARPQLVTFRVMGEAQTAIVQYEGTHGGSLPEDADGQAIAGSSLDGWGQGLRYRKMPGNRYELRSSGPDKVFETTDDVTTSHMAGELPPATGPGGGGRGGGVER